MKMGIYDIFVHDDPKTFEWKLINIFLHPLEKSPNKRIIRMIKQTPETPPPNKSEIKQTNVSTRIGKSISCANTTFSSLHLNLQLDLLKKRRKKEVIFSFSFSTRIPFKKKKKVVIFNSGQTHITKGSTDWATCRTTIDFMIIEELINGKTFFFPEHISLSCN